MFNCSAELTILQTVKERLNKFPRQLQDCIFEVWTGKHGYEEVKAYDNSGVSRVVSVYCRFCSRSSEGQ
eukprot:6884130-Pyramimonas_sp.AAC.1